MAAVVSERERILPETRAPLIELASVDKVYRMGKLDYHALRGIDPSIGAGELVAIVGPSGSGKTTILNLVTGIDRPSALPARHAKSGSTCSDSSRPPAPPPDELDGWRRRSPRFV